MLKVKFVSIPVSNQSRALKFYTEKLNFAVTTDTPAGDGQRWIELQPPGSETRVTLFTVSGQEDRVGTFQNIAFTSNDVEKTYFELRDRGVEFVQPANKADWGGIQAIFKDPDGNTFLISSDD